MENSKYPIGKFEDWQSINSSVKEWIDEIETLPQKLTRAVQNLSQTQLDTPYRAGGWTIRQVVHHLADSHANAYIRVKLAITENQPTIKPYDQDSWAVLPDTSLPVNVSLQLLESLHQRWTVFLKSLNKTQINRTVNHPKSGTISVKELIAQYAWHGNHHLAHIEHLKKRKNWT